MLTRRHIGGALAAALAAPVLAAPSVARAQSRWPAERPIQVIVPFPPGGGVDVMTRMILPAVEKNLPGARFVVQNRAGAGGQVGFEATFNAAPDGYTIGSITVPALNTIPRERAVRYRPMDFTFIANVVDDPNVIIVPPDSPIRTLSDLVDAARARPGELDYASTGIGSDDHILMLALLSLAGVEPMVHVPFPGSAPMFANFLGGHVGIAVANVSEILAMRRDGRAHVLAQAAETRWQAAADLPTFREQGFDLVAGAARGVVGPPGMPPEAVSRLEAAFRAALADPDFLREAERAGLPLRPAIGEEYRAIIAEVDARVQRLWEERPWG